GNAIRRRGRIRNEDPAGVLAEQKSVGTPRLCRQRDLAAEIASEAHLRQREREAALAGIVRGPHQTFAHQCANGRLHLLLQLEIEGWRPARRPAVDHPEVLARAEVAALRARDGSDEADAL